MAVEKQVIIDVDTKEGQKNIDKLSGSVDGLTNSVEKTEEASKDLAKQNKTTTKTAKGVSAATKAIGGALKAIGIGLIIALFAKLAEVFSRNQKVLDLFSNVTNTLSIAFNDLFSLFEGGLPSIDELGKSIKDNIIERFVSLLEVTGFLGSALKKLFAGDFKGALESVQEAGTELVDVFTGVDGSLNKITEYTKDIYEQAEATTALSNASQLAEVRLQGLIEKYDLQAETFRQVRDDERLTIKERIDANEALGKVLDEQREAQLKQASISVASAQAQIAATGDNIENQVALQQALNELAATEAQIAGFRSEQIVNQASLEKELDEARLQRLEDRSGFTEDIETDPAILLAENNALALAEIDAGVTSEAEKQSDARKQISQLEADAKQQAFEGYADALSTISGVIGQQTVEGKALAIASSLINTYAAISGQLKAFSGVPIPGYAIAQAIATGVAGFANVAKIASVKVPSASGGASGAGGSVPSGGGRQSPTFNTVGTSGANQIAQSLQGDDTPIKAVVVGSDVTTQQAADRNIVDTATIG